jgi:hypothetical protein
MSKYIGVDDISIGIKARDRGMFQKGPIPVAKQEVENLKSN